MDRKVPLIPANKTQPAAPAAATTPPVEPQAAASAEERGLSVPAGTERVQLRLKSPSGEPVEVELEAQTGDGRSLRRQVVTLGGAVSTPSWTQRLAAQARSIAVAFSQVSAVRLSGWLMALSLGLYAFTRLVALPSFPIYFFTDEAVQTVLAADLLRDRWHSYTGEFLPTFFQNGQQYNLGVSVYLQVIPYFFFGKSIWVTRGAAALMTLLAAGSVGLILKRVFRSPYPWLAVLLLSVTPVWFLHSRTAFETSLGTSFFAVFLYFYLLYRSENPRYLYPAILFGALAFYSYSPLRLVMAVNALLLFLTDLPYHWQHRPYLVRGAGLVLILAIPFLRFLYNHPDATSWQMRLLGSYWVMDIPLAEKLDIFVDEYFHGLDPLYWYLPHESDLSRHTMLGYGHLLRPTLPLGLLGVALAIRNIRSAEYRTLLIAVLAAPTGAALVRLGVTRVMTMVIPMAILSALAAASLMTWLQKRMNISQRLLALSVFLLLSGANLFMLVDALVNGPYWYRDYGLVGMQYGARQVFGEIERDLRRDPETRLILSPSWANGTDVVARFFFRDPLPFDLGSAEGYYHEVGELDERTLFVMTPEEFEAIPRHLFQEVKVEKTLPYPDGRPGFYFVRLKYVENAGEVIAAEKEKRRRPVDGAVWIDGQQVPVSYSKLDVGEIQNILDGDPDSLVRSWAINPLELAFHFPAPRSMQGVSLRVGGTPTTVNLRIYRRDAEMPYEMTRVLEAAPKPREVQFDFPETFSVTDLSIEVLNTLDPPEGHVHLWEVMLK